MGLKKVVCINSYPGGNCGREICDKLGGKFHVAPKIWRGNQKEIYKDISNADLVLLWSELEPCTAWVKNLSEHLGIPHLYLERGFVPQAGHYSLDTKGNIKNSSLNDSLGWMTSSMKRYSEQYCNDFFVKKNWSNISEEYILCPLQLEWDTSVYLCSKYDNMDQFLLDVIEKFPNEKIIVTPHPLYRNYELKSGFVKDRIKMERKKSTMEMAQRAKIVVGITSTVLYEALAMGKKVMAMGDCPVKSHEGNRLLALAAVHRQFKHGDMEKFLNLAELLLKEKGY